MSLGVGLLFGLALVASGWWPMRRWGSCLGAPWWSRSALALALGVVVTGSLQWVLSLAGWPAGPWPPLALAVLSLLATRRGWGLAAVAAEDQAPSVPPLVTERVAVAPGAELIGTRAAGGSDGSWLGSPSASGEPSPWADRLLLSLLLALALVSAGAGVGLPFKGDGSKFWASRARELARDPVLQAPALNDPLRVGFHPNYPLLVPMVLAPVFAWSPRDATTGPKLVLQLLALSLLALLARLLWPLGNTGRLVLLAFAAMPGWVSLDVRESWVAGGYMDVACALFLLLLVDGVDRLRRGQGAGSLAVLSVLAAGGLLSTKLEGGVELLVVVTAWALAGPRRAGLAWLVVGAALLAVPGLITRLAVLDAPAMGRWDFLVDPRVLLARGVPLAAGLAGLLLDSTAFGLLPLLLLALAFSARRRLGRLLPWLVLGATGFVVVVYLASSMHLSRHLYTSAHRLALHWLPAFCVLIARAATAAPGQASSGAGTVGGQRL